MLENDNPPDDNFDPLAEDDTDQDDTQDDPQIEGEGEDEPGDDEGLVIELGDQRIPTDDAEPPEEQRGSWVKEVRRQNREMARELRELKAKLATAQPAAPDVQDPGPKPTLEQFAFVADEFEPALEKWMQQKAKADALKAQRQQQAEEQAREWVGRVQQYESGKKSLGVPDFDDAESVLRDSLDETQQGIIVHGTSNPALFVYAVGKTPSVAKELAAIKDPVKFAMKVGEIQTKIKMNEKRKAPPPETKPTTGGSVAPRSATGNLEKLRAQAEKTGNYTAYLSAKRSMKKA